MTREGNGNVTGNSSIFNAKKDKVKKLGNEREATEYIEHDENHALSEMMEEYKEIPKRPKRALGTISSSVRVSKEVSIKLKSLSKTLGYSSTDDLLVFLLEEEAKRLKGVDLKFYKREVAKLTKEELEKIEKRNKNK